MATEGLILDAPGGSAKEVPTGVPKLVEVLRRRLKSSGNYCQEHHERARRNHLFASGASDQWDQKDRDYVRERGLVAFSLSETASVINATSGREVTGRFMPIVTPPSLEFQDRAAAYTQGIRRERSRVEVQAEETDAFRDLLVGAVSWTDQQPREDSLGIPRFDPRVIPLSEMFWDKRARRKNLVDRNWDVRLYWTPVHVVEESFGRKITRETLFPYGAQSVMSNEHIPAGRSWSSVSQGSYYSPEEDEVAVADMQWRESVAEYILAIPGEINPETGVPEMTEVRVGEAEFKQFSRDNPDFQDFHRVERDVFKYAVIVGELVIEEGELAEGMFTRLAMTGQPEKQDSLVKWVSQVDWMREPQKWANAMLSLYLHLLSTSPKNTFIIEEGRLVKGSDDMARRIGLPGAAIFVRGDVNTAVRVERGGTFPMVEGALEFGRSTTIRQGGLDPYSLGQVDDLRRTAASSIQSIQSASAAQLSVFFDSLRVYRRESAKIQLANFSRWRREDLEDLVGEMYAENLPQDPSEIIRSMEWEISIDEAPSSTSGLKDVWDTLAQHGAWQMIMGHPLLEPPPEVFIRMMPDLPHDVRRSWLDSVKQKMEAMQAQQEQPAPEQVNPEEEVQ